MFMFKRLASTHINMPPVASLMTTVKAKSDALYSSPRQRVEKWIEGKSGNKTGITQRIAVI